MAAYERNTGSPHPLAGGIIASSKRDTGSVVLTEDSASFWYTTISIGTPAEDFTGENLFSPAQNWPFDLWRVQLSLTPGAVISSSLQSIVTCPAQGTKRMIHLLAPPRKIKARSSRFPIRMVRLSVASNMVKLLSSPVWLYVEPFFSFLSLQSAYTSHHRRRTRL